MSKKIVPLLIFCFYSLQFVSAAPINTIALKNGCRIVQKPSTFFTPTAFSAKIDAWSTYALQDESDVAGWCSGAASKVPYVFVFELSEDYFIKKLVFNTRCQKEYKLISAKDVKVEYSTTSAKTGFVMPASYSLKQDTINTFEFAPVKARWVKLTILSNHGNLQWTELMEFEAWGDFVNPTLASSPPIIGVWNSDFDWVSINKAPDGLIYGCYKWANGELYLKDQNRKKFSFAWSQKDDGQHGWCVLVMNKEGTKISGIWGINNDTTKFGHWEFTKVQNAPYACGNDLTASKKIIEPIKIDPKINVLIEVVDKSSNKPIPGTIEMYTFNTFYKVPSGDGQYTADINIGSYVVIKTFLPNYFPTIDTFAITESEKKALYVSHIIDVSKLKTGNIFLLQNLLFTRTSADLSTLSYPILDQLVLVMNQYPNMIIELSGHTDNVGNAKQNLLLSKKRVDAAKQYLVTKGVNPDRIKSVGYGSKYPVASNDGEQTRKFNRRVELRIIMM